MKKEILLLEDKDTRDSLNVEALKELEKTTKLEVILGEDNCNNLLDKFMEDSKIFNQYSTIIIHENIYKNGEGEKLFEKLRTYNDKNIVIFSGDSDFSLINNILTLSAKILYSENLKIFLKESDSNLLVLGFGKNWSSNILLNILEKLNIFIEKNSLQKFDFDTFENNIELLEIKEIMDDDTYLEFIDRTAYEDKISQEQIIKIQQNLYKYITELSE